MAFLGCFPRPPCSTGPVGRPGHGLLPAWTPKCTTSPWARHLFSIVSGQERTGYCWAVRGLGRGQHAAEGPAEGQLHTRGQSWGPSALRPWSARPSGGPPGPWGGGTRASVRGERRPRSAVSARGRTESSRGGRAFGGQEGRGAGCARASVLGTPGAGAVRGGRGLAEAPGSVRGDMGHAGRQ